MSGTEVLIALSAVSAVVGAAGALQAGAAQAEAAEFNAAVSEQEAKRARQAAAFEEQRVRDAARRVAGAQRAAIGASGIGFEGSPLLVMAETAEEAEIDALAVRFSGSAAEARAKSQATLDRLEARQARTTGFFKAGASILGGAKGIAEALNPPKLKLTLGT